MADQRVLGEAWSTSSVGLACRNVGNKRTTLGAWRVSTTGLLPACDCALDNALHHTLHHTLHYENNSTQRMSCMRLPLV